MPTRCDRCGRRLSLFAWLQGLLRTRPLIYVSRTVAGKPHERPLRWVCTRCTARLGES